MGTSCSWKILALVILELAGGCTGSIYPFTEHGRIYPMDEASARAGIPQVEFVRRGLGSGPITVTMPNGEILQGEYQVTENATVGIGFSGGQTATALGYGSGRAVVANVVGNRGTIMNCEGTLDIGGHGSLTCQTGKGLRYRLLV